MSKRGWAVYIPAEGEAYAIELEDELKNYQRLVGGHIEVCRCGLTSVDDLIIICDEEGKLKGKPVNHPATWLYARPGDCIAGCAVVLSCPPGDESFSLLEKSRADIWINSVNTALADYRRRKAMGGE